jgi:hypothetical protein
MVKLLLSINKRILMSTTLSCLLIFPSLKIYSQTWSALGLGVTLSSFTYVDAITSYNNNIIIGGEFDNVSGIPANHVALWNGSSWQPMGTGIDGPVKCFAMFNGVLYAGADIIDTTSLYKWNGSSWVSAGPFKDPVMSLYTDTVHNIIYAGGIAQRIMGNTLVAKSTDGINWSNVGSGLNVGSFPAVYALITYNDTLYAGGNFSPNGRPYMVKWSGLSWVAPLANKPNNSVFSFTIHKDTLYIAGDFDRIGTTGSNYFIRTAKLYKGNWYPVSPNLIGPNNAVKSIQYYNGDIYATGTFTGIINGDPTASHIARWNRYNWLAVTTGLDNNGYILQNIRDTLFVGGQFTTAGSVSNTRNIARWYNPFIGCPDTAYFEGDLDVDVISMDSCRTLKVYGCTDPSYLEYNAAANIDDGSCLTLGIENVKLNTTDLVISPNPFSENISIGFNVTSQTFITIEVFDGMGRKIVTLVNERLNPGKHSYNFNGEEKGLSSGIYMLRIISNGISANHKLIKY